ncbi:MAG: 16S rRNA (adenine(1518)-N(6)/adenine(1519)-N(6))-dimethyltransferase RsmA [Alphaproteobacteria bacterium]|nr:16S rRNA (adenine(1518)-N(6)/adenine(1519)-N(6))-dimethyltransferase RsmA [Alphaproteobacteria bacterium]
MDKDIIKNINNLPSISQTIKEYNLFAKKKLSQNFILDLNLTNKIINLSDNVKYNSIIEIGPGPGSLTRSLLLNGAKEVIAIEKDKRFIDALQILKIASHNKLIIENEDALNINLKDIINKYNIINAEIIANLPYSIATKLLLKWIPFPKKINQMTLMFQKEVAERITAKPGSKKYGRLSILIGLMAEAKIIMHIPSDAFKPQPKVDSAIVQIKPKINKIKFNKIILEEITKNLFNQRRKQIKSTLIKFGDPLKICSLLNIAPSLRPEQITLEQYENMAILIAKNHD